MPSQTKMKPVPFVSAIALLLCAAAPSTALAMASSELYSTEPHFYGRFEARIRYAAGDGVVSSFFLWKEGSSDSGAYWNELDMEKVGAKCEMHTNAYYGKPAAQHTQTNSMPSDICADYHTYAFEWTPTYISWFIDGKEFRKETGATATAFAQNATGGMTMHFNLWPGNSGFGGDISKTTLPVHQYISWVQYSSYDNGNFTVKSREEFDGSSIPTGWAVGNWSSPFNLSTHNAQNVSLVNGIAVMSLTNDNATGNPGTPPVDSAAPAGTGGSPGTGGASNPGTGGASGAAGGAVGAGGAVSSGGAGASGTGGKTAAGGSVGTGGSGSFGGAVAQGGATTVANGGSSSGAQGGNNGVGGSSQSNNGGSSSASASTGGSSPPAGSTGGASNTGGGSTQTNSSSGCSMAGGHPSAATALFGLILGVFAISRRKRMIPR